jgi:hypothetical protein
MNAQQLAQGLNRALEAGDMEAAAELRDALRQVQGASIMDPKRGPQVSQGQTAVSSWRQGGTFGRGSETMGAVGARADSAYQGMRDAGVPSWLARPAGAIGSMLMPSTYEGDQNRAGLTRAYEDERVAGTEQHPWTAGAAELGGALVPGIGIGKATTPLFNAMPNSRVLRAAGYSALGAGEGFLYGSGANMDDRMEGGKDGAVLGAIAAPAMAGLGVFGGWGIGAWNRAFRSSDMVTKEQAARALRKVADAEGVKPDDVIQWLQEDTTRTLADYSTRFKGAMGNAVARAHKDAREETVANYASRSKKDAGALEIRADEIMGTGGRTYREVVKEMADTREQLGQQEYQTILQAARGTKPRLDADAQRLMKDPDIANALEDGKVLAQKFDATNESFWDQLHWAQSALNDKIGAAYRAGHSALGTGLRRQREQILDILDNGVPGYEATRGKYSTAYDIERAAEAGRNLFTGNKPFEALDDMAKLEGDKAAAFVVGAKDAIRQRIRDAGDNAANTDILPSRLRHRLKAVLGEDDIDELFRHVDEARKRGETGILAAKAKTMIEEPTPPVSGDLGLFLTHWQAVAGRTIKRILDMGDAIPPRVADEMLELLAKPIKTKEQAEAVRRAITQLETRYTGAAGFGGTLGGILEEN